MLYSNLKQAACKLFHAKKRVKLACTISAASFVVHDGNLHITHVRVCSHRFMRILIRKYISMVRSEDIFVLCLCVYACEVLRQNGLSLVISEADVIMITDPE